MPKEHVKRYADKRDHHGTHRSSSSDFQRHGHLRHREHYRMHPHRHHREKESRSSTHIYFNQPEIRPSVSLHTDHVALASTLSQMQGMSRFFENFYQLLDGLHEHQGTVPANYRSSSVQRGANHANLVSVPQSTADMKPSNERFSMIMETCKRENLIPAEQTGEVIRRSLLSDCETQLEKLDISLSCPLTRARMVIPARGRNCTHVHCFDGEAYVRLMWGKQLNKWKCPICRCFIPLNQLIVDGLFLDVLKAAPEKCKTVSFTPDGKWQTSGCSPPVESDKLPQMNTEVVDLTFDTPDKMANHKNVTYQHECQVIDLTISP